MIGKNGKRVKQHQIVKMKDSVHTRLLAQSEMDPLTDCYVFVGPWQKKTGLGVMRCNGRMYTVPRLAMWAYYGGFDLDDRNVRVSHRKSVCKDCPACFNPDHLIVHCSDGSIITEGKRHDRAGNRIGGRRLTAAPAASVGLACVGAEPGQASSDAA